MPDRIGNFTFISLSRPPLRTGRDWDVIARSGVDGVAIWSTGDRGEPFTVESLAVAVTFAFGRTFLPNYKTLELLGPVDVQFGTVEQGQLYKILRVHPVGSADGCKAIPRGKVGGDATNYQCLVRAAWTLLPINPFIQPPT